MSNTRKQPSPNDSRHDPLGLFWAILIGVGLGFIAVLVVPYVIPPRNFSHETQPHAKEAKVYPAQASEPKASATPALRPKSDFPASELPESEKRHAPEKQQDEAAGGGNGSEAGAASKDAASTGEGDGKKASPAGDKEDVKAKPEPVLVPAVEVTFPKPFSNKEMSEALQPLLTFRVGEADAASIKEALTHASKDQDSAAQSALARITNAVGRKLAQWRCLGASNTSIKDVLAFRAANPEFPAQALDADVERALFLADPPAAAILKFFANRKPLSGAGKACLGGALLEKGEHDRGISLIRQAWTHHSLEPGVQSRIESRFDTVLNEEDQDLRKTWLALKARKQEVAEEKPRSTRASGIKAAATLRRKHGKGHLLHGGRHGKSSKGTGRASKASRSHGRWKRRRGEAANPLAMGHAQASAAVESGERRSLIETVSFRKRKPKSHPKEAKAEAAKPRQTAQSKASDGALNLSKAVSASPTALLSRLKALRKSGEDDRMRSILRSLKPTSADLFEPERWWEFRRTEARRALNDGMEGTAYAIAKVHGPVDDESEAEAEFLAGWISLRFLDEPKQAEAHFEAARHVKGSARDEARSLYWLARAEKQRGAASEAEALFREAATRFYTYYGQLARQSLREVSTCEFRPPARPTSEDIAAFTKEDAFKAVMIIKQLDLKPLLVSYVLDLARQITSPQEMTLLLELTERIAPHHLAVRAAKIALLRGFATEAYAFPTLLPKFDPAGDNVKIEPSLLNALTRQESEFNSGSVSSVGARGLMQLMPQTARLVAASHKLKYEQPRLVSDPSYNVTLGSAFLASLMSGYDGSYILSLAAYNAGPGRVASWIKQFGDPRDKSVDPIDWVERIPFNETRDYVERILESTQLYRCRFEGGKAKMQLMQDLHRGRPGKMPDIAEFGGLDEPENSP